MDQDLYSHKQSHISQSVLSKPPKNSQSNGSASSKVKTSKRVILDPKWTNYSQQFLQNKWSSKDSSAIDKSDTSSESSTTSSIGSSSDSLLSELSLKSLPNIDELFGCTNILENACNIVTIQYQLIEDSEFNPSSVSDIEMENFTDISELPC